MHNSESLFHNLSFWHVIERFISTSVQLDPWYAVVGQIQIGTDFLQSSFSILEDQPMDMLLGLDMLKRHQVR